MTDLITGGPGGLGHLQASPSLDAQSVTVA